MIATPGPPKAPVLEALEVELEVGQRKTLSPLWKDTEGESAEVGPPDATGDQVKWTVIPPGIVNIVPSQPDSHTPGGMTAEITAISAGSCTVTATLVNGLVSTAIHVKVNSEGAVSGEVAVSDD